MRRTRAGLIAVVAVCCAGVAAAVTPAAASPLAANAGKTACFGKAPTIFSSKSNVTLKGTKKADVIESTGKNVTIVGNGGNDRICGLDVKKVITGTGNAKVQVRSGTVVTGKGTNTVVQKGKTTKHITFDGGKGVTAFTVPASELAHATVVPGVLGDTLNGRPLALGLPTGAPRALLGVEDNNYETVFAPATAMISRTLGPAATYPNGDGSYADPYDYEGTHTDFFGNNTIRFQPFAAAPAGADIASWSLDLGDGSPPRHSLGAPPPYLYAVVHGVGTHTATLTVVDTLGRSTSSSVAVNQAGYADAAINAVVPGSPGPTTLNLTYTRGPGQNPVQWALDYGDGTAPTGGSGAPPTSLTHTYPYGDYRAELYTIDDHGDEETASTWVTYTAPSTAHLSATPVYSNGELNDLVQVGTAAASHLRVRQSIGLQIYDPYSAYVSIDWGDGVVASHTYAHEAIAGHSYDHPGSYVVTVKAVDTSTVASVQVPITVVPDPVHLNITSPTTVSQGPLRLPISATGLPAGDAWSITFSDGSPPMLGYGALPSAVTHTFNATVSPDYGYGGAAMYVGVAVYDAHGVELRYASTSLTVTGPYPSVAWVGFGQGISEGYQGWAPLVAGGSGYTAAGLQASAGRRLTSATVSFGDGSAPVTVTDIGGGYLPADETGHTYANAGDYTLTVTVTDSSGRHSSASSVVSVAGRPTATLPATESSSTPTHTFTLTGISAAAGANDLIVGYTALWGDGSATTGVGAPPSSLVHTYTAASSPTVALYVVTEHGLYAEASTNATVA